IHSDRYRGLAQEGAKIFACAYGCQQHHVPTETIDAKMSLCGLFVLSGIIEACDLFLSFT
ncbi:MAG: hypothetical protein OEV27_04975, partial [Nitrospira sp.]|nr:hypothetical protein [Nitrospira sp.]